MQCVLGLECHQRVKSDDTQNLPNNTQTTFLNNHSYHSLQARDQTVCL